MVSTLTEMQKQVDGSGVVYLGNGVQVGLFL